MNAIAATKYGPSDVLNLEEVQKPVPDDNEVLIRGDQEAAARQSGIATYPPLRPGPATPTETTYATGRQARGVERGKDPMFASRLAHQVRVGSLHRMAALALGAVFALVVVGTVQASANAFDASSTNPPDFAAIDRYVEEEMAATRVPGAALGIVHGGEIVHLKGFGDADDSGRKVTPRTPFYIGSTSKSFTALATMKLVEADKVELDAPVQRYIPWFRLADPEASAHITVRDLLNQTSGIPNRNGYFWKQDGGGADALKEGVRFLRAIELDRPVGETFEYANANYTTLGLIVQMVSGEPYEQYVKDHILTPLDMKNSFMFVPEAVRHGLATEHRFWFDRPVSGGGLPYNRAITPAGLISSDAQDMSRYLIAQLNEGRYEETRILSPEGVALMHRGSADNGGGDSYAMGWVDSVGVDGERFAWHNGDTGASHAYMAVMPESDWGVVLLTNGSNDLRPVSMDAIAQGVIAQLVGREPAPLPGFLEEPYSVPLLVILSAGALQVIGIARSAALLRRWRAHPARRPRGAWGCALWRHSCSTSCGRWFSWSCCRVSSGCRCRRSSTRHPTSVWSSFSAERSR